MRVKDCDRVIILLYYYILIEMAEIHFLGLRFAEKEDKSSPKESMERRTFRYSLISTLLFGTKSSVLSRLSATCSTCSSGSRRISLLVMPFHPMVFNIFNFTKLSNFN